MFSFPLSFTILFLLIDYFSKIIRISLSYFFHRRNARDRGCVFSIKRNSTNKTDRSFILKFRCSKSFRIAIRRNRKLIYDKRILYIVDRILQISQRIGQFCTVSRSNRLISAILPTIKKHSIFKETEITVKRLKILLPLSTNKKYSISKEIKVTVASLKILHFHFYPEIHSGIIYLKK